MGRIKGFFDKRKGESKVRAIDQTLGLSLI